MLPTAALAKAKASLVASDAFVWGPKRTGGG